MILDRFGKRKEQNKSSRVYWREGGSNLGLEGKEAGAKATGLARVDVYRRLGIYMKEKSSCQLNFKTEKMHVG